MSDPPGDTPAISQLKEMGFSEDVSRRVLSKCAWDVNKAGFILFEVFVIES